MSRPLAVAALSLLLLPVVGLVAGTGPTEIVAALTLERTRTALWLSLWTTTVALAAIVALGLPLAWWMSRAEGGAARGARLAVELSVVVPPAVLGVALLETFGRQGVLPLGLPFTTAAVVLAQVLVGLPLFALLAAAAFRSVDDDLLLVARTLGAGPARAFATVAIPTALPGLLSGAGLAWCRALGEFGATLMFAGNLPGRTQTLPLAIYGALERDLAEARALSLILVVVAAGLLLMLRLPWRGGWAR